MIQIDCIFCNKPLGMASIYVDCHECNACYYFIENKINYIEVLSHEYVYDTEKMMTIDFHNNKIYFEYDSKNFYEIPLRWVFKSDLKVLFDRVFNLKAFL